MAPDVFAQAIADYPMARSCPFDPPPELVKNQKQHPIKRIKILDGSEPWLVTGYKEVREILSDRRMSSDSTNPKFPFTARSTQARRKVSRSFISMDSPEHLRLRRMVTRDFMVSHTRAIQPRVQEIVDGLIDAMLAGPQPADLIEAFALPVPSLVICELLGISYSHRKLFHDVSRTMISRLSTAEQTAQASRDMHALLRRVVDEKDKEPQDDLISRLVVDQMRTGALDGEAIVNTCELLLVAGHETTANQIGLSTLVFLQHPELLERLRTSDDPAVVANAVEEMLRYLSIIQNGLKRVATEDFEFHGQHIRAGDGVVVAIDAANRDEDAFPNPNEIDFDRKVRHHVAFGFGMHQCLGQPLARVELEVVYSTLFRRIPTLALAIPFDQVEFKNSIVYGLAALPVTW